MGFEGEPNDRCEGRERERKRTRGGEKKVEDDQIEKLPLP